MPFSTGSTRSGRSGLPTSLQRLLCLRLGDSCFTHLHIYSHKKTQKERKRESERENTGLLVELREAKKTKKERKIELRNSLSLSPPSMADALRFSVSKLNYSSTSSSNSSQLLGLSTRRKNIDKKSCSASVSASTVAFPLVLKRQKQRLIAWKVHAAIAETEGPKWWERGGGPNMIDIHSTQEFLDALSQAGDRLVIVEFYGTWCGSCRALYPKFCRTAVENPDILFLKVNFDENKPMCKSLNVKVLPYFHFYRGSDGQLESFSCSLAKFQKIKDAIAKHNTARCSIGPPKGVGELDLLGSSPTTTTSKDKTAEENSR